MIVHSEVDGVPVLFAPRTGPTLAGLLFRVGQADETLATRGITHLVEHLALHRTVLNDYHSNGSTSQTLTSFYLEGTEVEVVSFFGDVCRALDDLPLDRFDRERAILRTEEAGKAPPSAAGVRHGARDYGLTSFPEWGVDRLRPDEVAAWARDWFTRGNAALWLVGERVPPGLRLDLPAGPRRPEAIPSCALAVTPAWYPDGNGEVILDAVVERSPAAAAYAVVLGRELFRALRQDGGYSYTALGRYSRRDAHHAIVTGYADSLPDQSDAALGAFVDVMAKIRAGRIDEADVAAARAKVTAARTRPDADAERLPTCAGDLLQGLPVPTLDQLCDEAAAVRTQDVAAVARTAHDTALLRVPDNHSAEWAGYTRAAPAPGREVDGRRYPAIGRPDRELVIGAGGVTVRSARESLTVHFESCAARLDWPDGRRVFVANDGTLLAVEPTLFELDADGRAALDAGIDRRLAIRRPPRSPDAVPRPVVPEPEPAPAPPPPLAKAPRWIRVALWTATTVAVLLGIIAVMGTVDSIVHPNQPDDDWGTTAGLWFFAVVPAIVAARLRRRTRSGR